MLATVSLTASSVSFTIVPDPEIDVVLTKSKTSTNVTNFKNDLLNALATQGVNTNLVNITSVEAENVNIASGFTWQRDVSSSIGSISIVNNGKDVVMKGNESNPGKNAIWIIPDENQEQEFNFSYNIAQISGNSLYSVQQYASSHPQKDRQAAYGEYYKQSQNTDLPAAQTEEPLSSYTFKDFVTSQNKSIFYQQATSIYKGGTLGLETFSNMTGNKGLNRNYAVNAYNYVYNINKQPSVLIDFMHEYNQNFNVEI